MQHMRLMFYFQIIGENDIEGACGGANVTERGEADILSRLLCAVQARSPTVTPAGTDGSGPVPPAGGSHHRHDNDPQFSTAAHTDMLLLNLMRINGLTPKHSRHRSSRQNWSAPVNASETVTPPRRSGSGGRAPRRGPPPSYGPHAGPSSASSRPRKVPRAPPLSPGQLRRRWDYIGFTPSRPGCFGASRPGTPERGAQSPVRAAPPDYWPSASSLSDNDEVDLVLDYNDTLFDMLLSSLSIEGGALPETGAPEARPSTPPVHPWCPPAPAPAPAPGTAPPPPSPHQPPVRHDGGGDD